MASDSDDYLPIKGDVESVIRINGRAGRAGGLLEIRLVGHPHRYRVRIDTSSGAPALIELHLLPIDGTVAEITTDAIRAVPTRRLANAAARFAMLDENKIALAGEDDDPTSLLRPDHVPGKTLDDTHYRQVRNLLLAARRMGLSPREYVKDRLHASIPTVDRWIKEAKNRGFLDPDWASNNGHDLG